MLRNELPSLSNSIILRGSTLRPRTWSLVQACRRYNGHGLGVTLPGLYCGTSIVTPRASSGQACSCGSSSRLLKSRCSFGGDGQPDSIMENLQRDVKHEVAWTSSHEVPITTILCDVFGCMCTYVYEHSLPQTNLRVKRSANTAASGVSRTPIFRGTSRR
jgi:hypothetical protein